MKDVHSIPNKIKRKKKPSVKIKKYYLGTQYPDIYFTEREAHCMVLFLKNFSIAKTAAQLGLSPRTIEYYNELMKNKLCCYSKKKLVEKVSQSSFMSHVKTILATLNK